MKSILVIMLVSILMFATALPVEMTTADDGEGTSGERDDWFHIYAGTNKGYSVDQTDDGGYIITGYKAGSSTGSDVLLIKTYADGTMEWEQTFGTIYKDIGHSVQQTNDGGYIITGETRSEPGGNYDVHPWLIKTYADGTMEWNQTYVRSDDYTYDIGYSVQQTDDGGYIIVGMALQLGAGGWNVWLIKTYEDGTMEWNQTFDRSDEKDEGYSVDQTDDGGYIITGRTYLTGTTYNVWLIKTYADGTMEWNQTFGGSTISSREKGHSVQQTDDGGYIITGETNTYSTGSFSDFDIWLIKTDHNGNEMWNQAIGGIGKDVGYSVDQTDDGGYIIAGETRSFGIEYTHPDGWLIKTDQNGNEMWNKTFGAYGWDDCRSVLQADDNAYVMTGYTVGYADADQDVWLIKYDPEAENHPPETPDAPDGPSEGGFDVEYDFTAVTTDQDGDVISFRFRWGDGTESDWTDTVPSNVSVTVSHSWDDPGFFDVQVQAKDLLNTTDWSPVYTIEIVNHPPETPDQPNGPTNGYVDIEYIYTTNTVTVPEGDDVQYGWDWNGDIDVDEWTDEPSASHAWNEARTYEIGIKARNILGAESGWSDTLTITVTTQSSLLEQLVIIVDSPIVEKSSFIVIVKDDTDGIVEGADVMFNGETKQTDTLGQVEFIAPSVEVISYYTLLVSKEGYESYTTSITVLNQNEELGWIWGLVYDDSGDPIDDAKICAMPDGSTTSKCTFTDEEGRYIISILVGTYIVEASKEGYETSSETITIVKNTAIGLDFELKVSIKISDEEGGIAEYIIDEKIRENKVAAEIDATMEDHHVTLYTDDITIDVVSAGSLAQGDVSLTVSGEGPATMLVIYIGTDDPDSVVLKYDEKMIYRTTDIVSFFSSKNTDESWAMFPTDIKGEYVVLLTILNFSEHSITISSVVDMLVGPTAIILYVTISLIIFFMFFSPMILNIIHRRTIFKKK